MGQSVTDWLYYLVEERELSASSVNIAVNAVRFLYGVTLGRNTNVLMASVPRMKHSIRRAEIYARSEVEAILSAPRQPRDRAFLMTVYACGLRLAEARHLKTTDIDRARMQLRVRKGKGGKERVLPLSNRLLKELGDYRRAQRQGKWGDDIPWLFLGYRAEPICTTRRVLRGQSFTYDFRHPTVNRKPPCPPWPPCDDSLGFQILLSSYRPRSLCT